MEVFGHFVFPRFSGFFRAFPFVYRLFRAFLFTILFRHFVLPPIDKVINPDAETADSTEVFAEDTERAKTPKKKPKKTSADSLEATKTEETIQKTSESTEEED